MSDRTETSAARCVRLYRHFLRGGRITTTGAARLLGIAPRRAREDLKLLASVAPIRVSGAGRDSAWVLDAAEGVGHLGILDRISLQLGREVASFLEGTALHEGLDRVGGEERGAVVDRYALHLERKFRHLQEPARSYAQHRDVLDEVLDALLRERVLSLKYEKADGLREYPRLLPLTIAVYRRALYLLAWDPVREGVLRLSVDWIREAVVGAPFSYPLEWDPDAELGSAFGMVASGSPTRVVLRFSARMRRYLTLRTWHPTARLAELPDGRMELVMQTTGRELVRFALEWGENVEVVEPAWLREAVIAELEGALSGYRQTVSASNSEPGE